MPDARILPHSLPSERAVLGGVLLDNDALDKVATVVTENDFYEDRHRVIYWAALRLLDKGRPIDFITVSEILRSTDALDRAGGIEYLTELTDAVPGAANIGHYAEIVKNKARLRRAIRAAGEITEDAFGDPDDVAAFLDAAEQAMFSISEDRIRAGWHPLSRLMNDGIKHVEELYRRKENVTGVPSGWIDLDRMTAGFQRSDLIIVAGRPSMGKTAFALNLATYAALKVGVPTAVFSLEMSKEQLALRIMCGEARCSLSSLRTGFLSGRDWQNIIAAAGLLSEAPLFIDDSPALSPLDVRAQARRLKREHDVGLIVIDYLQLMKGSRRTDSREAEISEISRSLKALAKELDVPVIALSQLNRKVEDRADKRPQLADLRESGAIEQDADVIVFIYRDEVYNKSEDNPKRGEAEIIIGKQRNGPVGTVKLHFAAHCSTFLPLSAYEED